MNNPSTVPDILRTTTEKLMRVALSLRCLINPLQVWLCHIYLQSRVILTPQRNTVLIVPTVTLIGGQTKTSAARRAIRHNRTLHKEFPKKAEPVVDKNELQAIPRRVVHGDEAIVSESHTRQQVPSNKATLAPGH